MAPYVSSYNLEKRAHGPLCFSLRILMDTHPDISLHSIRMGPNPQTNKTKEMGATDCLKARGPEVLLQQSLCRRELAVLTALVRTCAHPTPPKGGGLAGAAVVCGMLTVRKDGQLTVFKFSLGPSVNHLILGEVILCCLYKTCTHMFTHAHRSTH